MYKLKCYTMCTFLAGVTTLSPSPSEVGRDSSSSSSSSSPLLHSSLSLLPPSTSGQYSSSEVCVCVCVEGWWDYRRVGEIIEGLLRLQEDW